MVVFVAAALSAKPNCCGSVDIRAFSIPSMERETISFTALMISSISV